MSREVRGKGDEQKAAKALPSVGRPFHYSQYTVRANDWLYVVFA